MICHTGATCLKSLAVCNTPTASVRLSCAAPVRASSKSTHRLNIRHIHDVAVLQVEKNVATSVFLVYLDTEKLVIRNGELVKRNHILHFAVALDAWSIVFGEQRSYLMEQML